MTESDDLRDRIARTDPARDAVLTPAGSPPAQALLEDIMNTPTDTPDTFDLDRLDGGDAPRQRDNAKEFLIGIGAVAAVVALVWGGIVLFGGGDDDEPERAEPTPTVPLATSEIVVPDGTQPPVSLSPEATLLLSLGQGQDPAASCIRPSAEVLAPVEMAFAGTASVVDGERVVLDVTRWFTGGVAGQVELTAPSGMEALTGGIPFEVGGQYLISAFGGVVNYCGLSGPATPELQAMYDQAFPG